MAAESARRHSRLGTLSRDAAGTGKPAGEVALEATQVGAAAAVTDVAIGPYEILGRPPDAESGERLATGVDKVIGCSVAAEAAHHDETRVALL